MNSEVQVNSPLIKKFAVIHFSEEQRYSSVPVTWLNEEKTICFWPPKKVKNCTALIKDPNSRPESNWKGYGITLVKVYGNILFNFSLIVNLFSNPKIQFLLFLF